MGKELAHHPSLHASRPSPQHHRRALMHAGVCAVWGVGFSAPIRALKSSGPRPGAGRPSTPRQHHVFSPAGRSIPREFIFSPSSQNDSAEKKHFISGSASPGKRDDLFLGITGSGAGAFVRVSSRADSGFGTLGPFSGYTFISPSSSPRLRTTGCGFCITQARILAAGVLLRLVGSQRISSIRWICRPRRAW